MNEQTFEELEQRLWHDPESLSEEELEQLLAACYQKERNTYENSLPAVA